MLAALTDSLAAALVAVEPGPERARFSGSVHGTTKCDGGTLVHLSPSGEQSPGADDLFSFHGRSHSHVLIPPES